MKHPTPVEEYRLIDITCICVCLSVSDRELHTWEAQDVIVHKEQPS